MKAIRLLQIAVVMLSLQTTIANAQAPAEKLVFEYPSGNQQGAPLVITRDSLAASQNFRGDVDDKYWFASRAGSIAKWFGDRGAGQVLGLKIFRVGTDGVRFDLTELTPISSTPQGALIQRQQAVGRKRNFFWRVISLVAMFIPKVGPGVALGSEFLLQVVSRADNSSSESANSQTAANSAESMFSTVVTSRKLGYKR